MKASVLSAAALALALSACAAGREPYAPVRDPVYTALGHDPFWLVTIGDDRMVLTLGPPGGRADGGLDSYAFPRVLPRTDGDVRRWESADGPATLTVEARPGPCEGSAGMRFEHHVRVTLSGRALTGCGGRQLAGRQG
jgi:uncharacterized membrane protein